MREELRQAREDELEAVYALRGRAFGEGDPEGNGAAWFAAHDREDPWRAAGANYVATCAGEVVATLRIFARRIGMGAEELAVAGFGDVATDPAYQGRGHMRRLLGYVNAENTARGFALGLLFTDVRGVYAAAGFRPLPVVWYTLALPTGTLPEAVPAATAVGVEGWTIVPGGPEHVGVMRAGRLRGFRTRASWLPGA